MTNEDKPFLQNQNTQEEESFDFTEFCMIALRHWQYFVIAIIVALGISAYYILHSTPTYTRSMLLLIKNDDKKNSSGAAASLAADFQNLGITPSALNINNEILTISTPVMMQEAVKRLHLDVQMNVEEGFHSVPLYERSPITLLMPQAPDNFSCNFKMRLNQNQTAELYNFESGKGLDKQHITVKMNSLVHTPVGIIVIQPTKYWSKTFTNKEISVSKYPVEATGNMYASRLNVALSDKESTILNISIADESKQRADDLIYKLIDVYNEQWLKDRNRVAESTFEFITERLNTLSKELGDVDQKISDYKSEAMLPDIDAASSIYLNQSSKNNDQILSLKNQLSVATYIREYLHDRSKSGQYLPTNTGIGSTGIESMIANYNKTVTSRNDVLDNSSENSPLVQKFNTDIALQKQAIMHSLDNLITQIQSQINRWENTERQTNQKLATAPQQVKKLLSVGRQQKVKEALYIYLLQKREENELSKTYTAWNTRIIQPPIGSNNPSTPRKNTVLLLALAIGVAVPAGILFLLEALNKTVRGRDDVENMHMPLLAEIPAITFKKNWWSRSEKNAKRRIYVEDNNRDAINEAFRILRSKLYYYMRSIGPDAKIFMITSFTPNSGKSLISVNLARTISLNNKHVLTIDMDMRHASTSHIVPTPTEGLSAYLSGLNDDLASLVMHNAFGEQSDLLPVGIIPPNPSELLLSNRMATLMEWARNNYDFIILDCPPIDIVADTNIIRSFADLTLIIIRVGLTNRKTLRYIDELHKNDNYKHMGMVLNGSDITKRKNKYGYYNSYYETPQKHHNKM